MRQFLSIFASNCGQGLVAGVGDPSVARLGRALDPLVDENMFPLVKPLHKATPWPLCLVLPCPGLVESDPAQCEMVHSFGKHRG